MAERVSITGAERRFVAIVAAILLALTLVPLGVAVLVQPKDSVFSGFVVQARDGVSYIAKTTEGLQGHWLYHDPYTSEPHAASLVYAPYLLLGQLDRLLHLPIPLLLHLVTLGLGAALLWAVYLVAAECFPDVGRRKLGFLLAVLGGGVGVIAHIDILGYHLVSLDRQVAGSAGLDTLSQAPHIALICLGSAWLALILIRHQRHPRWRDLLAAVAWTLTISLVYPQMAVMWALLSIAVIGRPRQGPVLMALAITVAAVPYAVYGVYLRVTNPIFANWPPQSDIDIGDPLSYLLWGHLFMMPFIVLAATMLVRSRRPPGSTWAEAARQVVARPLRLLLLWIAVTTTLMYTPGSPSLLHRVYYASFIAFGLLAAAGLSAVAMRLSRASGRRLVLYGTTLMSVISIATVVQWIGIPAYHIDDYALYFPRSEATVLQDLGGVRPGGGALVMNSYLSGLWVPALSGQNTYLGLVFETLDTERRERDAETFYRLRSGDELERMAARLHLDYVLWGVYEKRFGGPDPGATAGWEVAYSHGDARLYRVGRTSTMASLSR